MVVRCVVLRYVHDVCAVPGDAQGTGDVATECAGLNSVQDKQSSIGVAEDRSVGGLRSVLRFDERSQLPLR